MIKRLLMWDKKIMNKLLVYIVLLKLKIYSKNLNQT